MFRLLSQYWIAGHAVTYTAKGGDFENPSWVMVSGSLSRRIAVLREVERAGGGTMLCLLVG